MAEVTIRTKDLSKRFRTKTGVVQAVNGVTLQVRRGETYGLIGPDGAGKTTTTRVILGLLRRTSGESSILGYDSMRDTYAIRERVGYIAQQFALPPDMTVMENMRFFADLHGVQRAEQATRIPELLDFAGLSPFTDRLAGRLSGGMKKKLALACSLVHEPQVVMLDEPTLGVDPVSRREFWNLLGNLRAEKGVSILVCTPYMDEAERCNWVGLMYEGKLIAQESPQGIKRMVSGRLLEFTPSDFVPAEQIVSGLEGVLEVQTYGLMLHVFVDDIARCQVEIEVALAAQGIACQGMREIEVRMEEAFISLIRRRRQER
ncbi:MAG: ABC transporter ATP-binding protein [Chloroflexi bacterium]|nr:ABC transporter ATP-binding protein [Chloroflexota bacterium]MBL7200268.1 ABC transporter ATP-binding protein [Anaerolineae bacterium]